jgi:four helix bundle protein
MKEKNVIRDKSYLFALRIVKLSRYLGKKNEFILSKQILRSGTSIGANIEEAIGCHSKKDFLAKYSIVYKEARETLYWLKLLRDSEFLENKLAVSLINDCEELLRIIGSIQRTLKSNLKENS